MRHCRKRACSPDCFFLMTSIGIMIHLKRSKDPPVLKRLNQCIKFSTKLALAQASVEFLCDCIEKNTYPRRYWNTLRKTRVRITEKSLRRHALNEKDTIQHQIEELKFNVLRSEEVLDILNETERLEFQAYVEAVSNRQRDVHLSKLRLGLCNKGATSPFPEHPERYVHNLSSLSLERPLLEVLSLGPKF